LVTALLIGCINKNEASYSTGIIDLAKNKNQINLRLSAIADSIEYIKLETDTACFISNIKNIEITEQYIVIQDQMLDNLYVFGRNGKFIRKIGNRGKGPGEFTDIFGFSISRDEGEIMVNVPGNDFMLFTLEGKFLKKVPKHCRPISLRLFNQFIVQYSLTPNLPISNGYALIVDDFGGNNKHKLLKREVGLHNSKSIGTFSSTYLYKDTLSFWEFLYDTIYGLSKDFTIHPRWILNLPKESLKKSDYNSISELDRAMANGGFYLNSIQETNNYLFFNTVTNRKRERIIVKKKDHSCNYLKNIDVFNDTTKIIANDIDNGPNFWPSGQINERQLYSSLSTSALIELYSRIKKAGVQCKSQKLSSIMESIGEIDNPIIMIVNLKL
jgi:hypothetical protein